MASKARRTRKPPAARQPRPAKRGHRSARARTELEPAAETTFEEMVEHLVDAGSREHYADAALYDHEYRRRRADVNFYRELARQRLGAGGRILELGAGTGRVTVPLARDGHRVTALDQAAPMLARLQSRSPRCRAVRDRIEPVRGELCTFELGTRFPLVIAAFNVLEHLYTRGELDACLRRVAAHLEPGGAFAFDVQLPDLAWLVRDPTKRWARTRFTDPQSGRAMYYSTNHDYDPVSQIVMIRLFYDPVDGSPGRVVKLTQRKFFPAELEALVAHAGFRVTAHLGDFSFRPLDGSADSQVVICEPAEPRRKTAR